MKSTFHYTEVSSVLRSLAPEFRIRLALDGRSLYAYPLELTDADLARNEAGRPLGSSAQEKIRLPLCLGPLDPCVDPTSVSAFAPEVPDLLPELTLERLLPQVEASPGNQLLLLVQAGAVAMGLWRNHELVVHKAFKRYVVRGKGRAQPTYRKTRGKSRYGSRLRLQNARRQFAETIELVERWRHRFGPFQGVFRSCPVRLWGELREALAEVLSETGPSTKIPLDVALPCFAELERVRYWMERGERLAPG